MATKTDLKTNLKEIRGLATEMLVSHLSPRQIEYKLNLIHILAGIANE